MTGNLQIQEAKVFAETPEAQLILAGRLFVPQTGISDFQLPTFFRNISETVNSGHLRLQSSIFEVGKDDGQTMKFPEFLNKRNGVVVFDCRTNLCDLQTVSDDESVQDFRFTEPFPSDERREEDANEEVEEEEEEEEASNHPEIIASPFPGQQTQTNTEMEARVVKTTQEEKSTFAEEASEVIITNEIGGEILFRSRVSLGHGSFILSFLFFFCLCLSFPFLRRVTFSE